MHTLISITTCVHTDEGDDSIEMVTEGDYGYGNGVIHLAYNESELTGMEGTRTAFAVQNGLATMTREGTVSSHIMFKTGEKHYFAYDTPYGMLTMGVQTHSVVNRLGIHGGLLELHYSIDVQGAQVSRNDVIINVKEVQ